MKTRIITIANLKGGVGKTTSALNLGASLALSNKRTLLIDMDPQSNLTSSLGAENDERDIYGVLLKEYPIKSAVYKIRDCLLLIPGSKNFPAFERNFGADIESFYFLKKRLDELTSKVKVDYIIIDCPPSLNLISTNAYVASHEVFVPLEAMEYSLDGLQMVKETVERINKKLNPALKLSGTFFTRYHQRKLISKEVSKMIEQEHPGLLLDTHIREDVKLKESPSYKQDIFAYAPDSNGAKDYMEMAKRIDELCPEELI